MNLNWQRWQVGERKREHRKRGCMYACMYVLDLDLDLVLVEEVMKEGIE